MVKTESNGAWVTGLPADVTLITLGQGFVNPGEEVEPISDTNQTNANQPEANQSDGTISETSAISENSES